LRTTGELFPDVPIIWVIKITALNHGRYKTVVKAVHTYDILINL